MTDWTVLDLFQTPSCQQTSTPTSVLWNFLTCLLKSRIPRLKHWKRQLRYLLKCWLCIKNRQTVPLYSLQFYTGILLDHLARLERIHGSNMPNDSDVLAVSQGAHLGDGNQSSEKIELEKANERLDNLRLGTEKLKENVRLCKERKEKEKGK